MKAMMLAAGIGKRLFGEDVNSPPKVLMEFGGKSLLARHFDSLQALGVDELTMVLGHRRGVIEAAAAALSPPGFVKFVCNPRYLEGSVISFLSAAEVLASGDRVLFMDADVLYHRSLLERLTGSVYENCFLLDRDLEEGDEPVKLCIRDGLPVEFGKQIEGDFDFMGEWPGFMAMSGPMAATMAAAAGTVEHADPMAPYEDAMARVLVSEPPGTFGFEDITGIPWIEIDFPEDRVRAERAILPLLG
ncbi:MAG TPA: phosphocholine cytidylyltransferase family protein [Rhodospirillales bacterium]|nr:phosphocholine cytidylyltransferase family protein [Rhodospirillales bacterium]